MICNLFVFRHAETTDNSNGIFSGWRDPDLTPKGFLQAQEVAEQLKLQEIDYAFTSHLLRAQITLEIVLKPHLNTPVFTDDRLLNGAMAHCREKANRKLKQKNPSGLPKFTAVMIFRLLKVKASRWLKAALCPLSSSLKSGFA